jgi:hypothetical protein
MEKVDFKYEKNKQMKIAYQTKKKSYPFAGIVIAFLVVIVFACEEKNKENSNHQIGLKINSQGLDKTDNSKKLAPVVSNFSYETYFDKVGPRLLGDINGDRISDTIIAVHVLLAEKMETAKFIKVTIDTTSPYEEFLDNNQFNLFEPSEEP